MELQTSIKLRVVINGHPRWLSISKRALNLSAGNSNVRNLNVELTAGDLIEIIRSQDSASTQSSNTHKYEDISNNSQDSEVSGFHLCIDGKIFPPDTPLYKCQIFEGSQIDLSDKGSSPKNVGKENINKNITIDEKMVLAVTGGLESGKWIELDKKPIVVGRSSLADLKLDCPTISPRHISVKAFDVNGVCDFERVTKNIEISDLDSQNEVSHISHIDDSNRKIGGKKFDNNTLGNNTFKNCVVEVNDIIKVGNSQLSVLKMPLPKKLKGFGHILLNPALENDVKQKKPKPKPIAVPKKSKALKNRISFSWAALLAPILFGVVMAMLFSPYMALFALMSPVMSIGSFLESKIRGRHSRIQLGKKSVKEMKVFLSDLKKYQTEETFNRRNNQLNPLKVLFDIENAKLWNSSEQSFKLAIGTGNIGWQPKLENKNGSNNAQSLETLDKTLLEETFLQEAIETLDSLPPLENVPIEIVFDENTIIGVISGNNTLGGNTLNRNDLNNDYLNSDVLNESAKNNIVQNNEIIRNFSRWLILQAAFLNAPSKLSIDFLGPFKNNKHWDWITWLPHFKSNVLNHLVLIDLLEDDSKTKNNNYELNLWKPQQNTIILANSKSRLPKNCHLIIQIDTIQTNDNHTNTQNGHLQITHQIEDNQATEEIQKTKLPKTFKVDGIDLDFAKKCVQRMARYKDSGAQVVPIEKEVKLGTFLNLPEISRDAQMEIWKQPSFCVPIGLCISSGKTPHNQLKSNELTPDELMPAELEPKVLTLDIVKDGPHGLIAGTTGSGKSELLTTITAGLAHKASPEFINFVLIDYKGGATFNKFEKLPHTVGLITDLAPRLAERALISLRAELTRREKILKAQGVKDLSELLLSPPPRLLIVVDEFASMVEELPEFLNSLVEIARRGRSLGVHLILATQRPGGIISTNISANTNFKICLRTQSESDSIDVINTTDAAFLPADVPGRACFRIGMEQVQTFQTASSTSVTLKESGPIAIFDNPNLKNLLANVAQKANVSKTEIEGSKKERKANAAQKTSDPKTDVEKIIQLAKRANQKMRLNPPHKPIAPNLPKALVIPKISKAPKILEGKNWLFDSNGLTSNPSGIPIGIVDMPENQKLELLLWEPNAGNLGLLGPKSTTWGVSASLLCMKSRHFDELFVMGIKNSEMNMLYKLPECVAICKRNDIEMRTQIINALTHKTQNCKSLILINDLETLLNDLESEQNFENLEKLDRLIYDGVSAKTHFIFTMPNISNSARRIQKRAYLRIYSGMRTSSDFLEAGILSQTANSTINHETELLGESGKEVKLASIKNIRAFIKKHIQEAKIDNTKLKEMGTEEAHSSNTHSLKKMPPQKLKRLPTKVKVAELEEGKPTRSIFEPTFDKLPFGLALSENFRNLETVSFDLQRRHFLISGDVNSGKSTALLTLLESSHKNVKTQNSIFVCICKSNSPLFNHPIFEICAETPKELDSSTSPTDKNIFLFIDDAESYLEYTPLKELTASYQVNVFVAGRNDLLHKPSLWLDDIKSSQTGLLLNPTPLDGELLGVGLLSNARLKNGQMNGGQLGGSQIKGRALFVSNKKTLWCQIATPTNQFNVSTLNSPSQQPNQNTTSQN